MMRPISIVEARRRQLVPLTFPLDPHCDAKTLTHVVHDLARGGIECALVRRMFPKRLLSQKQRKGGANAFGVEVWRALHRRTTPPSTHR
jgi:hypothetical protein